MDHAKGVLAGLVRQGVEHRLLVGSGKLPRIASGNIEAFDRRMRRKKDRVIAFERLGHEDRPGIVGAPTGGDRPGHELVSGKIFTAVKACMAWAGSGASRTCVDASPLKRSLTVSSS